MAQVITTKLLQASGIALAQLLKKDESTVSRLRSGERAVNVSEFVAVMDFLGYKLVSKDKLCVPDYELHMLRDAYAFISSSSDMSGRFSAWRESRPLEWDQEGVE